MDFVQHNMDIDTYKMMGVTDWMMSDPLPMSHNNTIVIAWF
jgi:hypothetical protein